MFVESFHYHLFQFFCEFLLAHPYILLYSVFPMFSRREPMLIKFLTCIINTCAWYSIQTVPNDTVEILFHVIVSHFLVFFLEKAYMILYILVYINHSKPEYVIH